MSLESISLGALGLVLLGVGYLFVVHVERALAVQERLAEAVSWKPPSEAPERYEETYEHRQGVFRQGGGILLVVGTVLLVVSIDATFLVESFPQ